MIEALCYHLRDNRVTLRLNEEVDSVEEMPDGTVVAGGDFGVVTSVISPLPGQTVSAGAVVPFTSLVVKPALTNIAEVRFLVDGNVIDTVITPLVSTPGSAVLAANVHALSGGSGFGTGIWGTNFTALFPGTYILTVQVVDSSGNVSQPSYCFVPPPPK